MSIRDRFSSCCTSLETGGGRYRQLWNFCTNFVEHELRVISALMKNITITMDDAVAEWVRVEAARRNTSVSRLLGEWLGEKMRQEDAYAQAMREALGFETWGTSGGPYLHRGGLTPGAGKSSR